MKETQFIKQNQEKWKRLEKAIQNPNEKADELSDLFIQVTDDLSYARTFYPNRSIRAYLNWLSQRIFFKIYRAKKVKKNSIWHFWTDELPQIMYESRKEVLLAFAVYMVSMLVGALSQAMDPRFASIILGDGYVNMTIKNIEAGDPMAVYKTSGPFGMSLGIIANNLYVALLTFLLGVFASVGAIGMLVSTGVMVGVFQYFFYERGLLGESFLTIWTHGALEISAIVLAGAAGIVLGKGLLFPGTYHQLKAFQVTAQRGLKVYLGIVPVIIAAGAIEGYITRMTYTPDWIRLTFILLCFALMLGYFVVYPLLKFRKGYDEKLFVPFLLPDKDEPIVLVKIKKAGEIFTEVLTMFRKHFGATLKIAASLSLSFIILLFFIMEDSPLESINLKYSPGLGIISALLDFETVLPYVNSFFLAGIAWFAHRLINKERNNGQSDPPFQEIVLWLVAIVPVFLFGLVLYKLIKWGSPMMALPFILPFLLAIIAGIFYIKPNPLQALIQGPKYVFKQFGLELVLNIMLLAISAIVVLLISSRIMDYLVHFVGMNFQSGSDWQAKIIPAFFLFLSEFILLWTFFGFVFGAILSHFSAKEITEATNLKKAIENIGTEKRIKGMLRE